MWKSPDKEETHELISKVMDVLFRLSWTDVIKGFDAQEHVYELAKYATTHWLSDTHENQMLDLLRQKVHRHPGGMLVEVENTYFYGYLVKGYEARQTGQYKADRYFTHTREIGHALSTGLRSQIGCIANINGNHWVAFVLDFRQRSILIADSLGVDVGDLLNVLHWWTSHHTGHHFTQQSLAITHQLDGFSCGLLSFNALAHHFLPDTNPLIGADASAVANGRLRMMLDVAARHFDQVGNTSSH
ncbi:hypothetical protein M405DRAFT_754106 [Rhizopogon salebrosus TDB-379]|nr:hypothetical protein M405DRAFT_754106 [Rhizopogon salebrosus TDB-379]